MFATCSTSLVLSSTTSSEKYPIETEWEQPSEIKCLSWSKDNMYIAVLRNAKRAQILSVANLNDIKVVSTVLVENASSLTFKHKSKRFLAIGTTTGNVVLYDVESKKVTKTYALLDASIEHMEFSADDVELAVTCEDTIVVFSSGTNGTNKYKHIGKCCSLKFHPITLHQLAVGCSDGCVTVWNTKNSSKFYFCQLHSQAVKGLCLSKIGNKLITLGEDRVVYIVDLNSGKETFKIILTHTPASIGLKQDDAIFAIGFIDGELRFYQNVPTVVQLSQCKLHKSSVNTIQFANSCENQKRNDHKLTEAQLNHIKTDVMIEVKKDLENFTQQEIADLQKQMENHIKKFHTFLQNEFKLLNEAMEDKWNIFIKDENQAHSS